MRRRGLKSVLLLAGLLMGLPAAANDSTAELAAGGLILTRSDSVEMRSEDLFISQDQVIVRYRFLNTTPGPVRTIVAFPMPDIGGEGFFESDVGIPSSDPTNLLDFSTRVQGVLVNPRVEQKAMTGGIDRTSWLTSRGVPLASHLSGAREALDRLSPSDKADALKLGLATQDDFDAGKGWEHHLAPAWVLKTTFHWEQIFPVGREIAVEHRYRPALGTTVDTIVGAAGWTRPDNDWAREMQRKYCIDDAFVSAVARGRKAMAGAGWYQERRIGYVLKTGANWARPIGDFRLVIDKGAPENLVSFCGEGVTKINPTRFEVRATDFTPTRDLDILILVPVRTQ